MSKKRKSRYKDYVPHPRYGDKPLYSGAHYSAEEIEQAHWSYERKSYFPETAIAANIDKQNYSIFPRSLYVDIEKQCRQCGRWFIFYAREQQYWYESLGFYVDADCVKCPDCRRQEQEIKTLMHAYEALLKKPDRTEEEAGQLKAIALELFQLGYIRDQHKIDRLK